MIWRFINKISHKLHLLTSFPEHGFETEARYCELYDDTTWMKVFKQKLKLFLIVLTIYLMQHIICTSACVTPKAKILVKPSIIRYLDV